MEPLTPEELQVLKSLFIRRLDNLQSSPLMNRQFLATINRRVFQLTQLVEIGADRRLIEFQFTQLVVMLAEEATKMYGKLEYGDLIINVEKKDAEQYRAEQKTLLEESFRCDFTQGKRTLG